MSAPSDLAKDAACYAGIPDGAASAASVYLVAVLDGIAPPPTNYLTDEYGNYLTDENGNRIVIS